MGKRKSQSTSKASAKRKKPAQSKAEAETDTDRDFDAEMTKMYNHIQLITERSNLMQRHLVYIQSKMREFAQLTSRQFRVLGGHIDDMKFFQQQIADDMYRLAPETTIFEDLFDENSQITCPNSPLVMDDTQMSEDDLIKAVGEYIDQ